MGFSVESRQEEVVPPTIKKTSQSQIETKVQGSNTEKAKAKMVVWFVVQFQNGTKVQYY
jgi:hypothetical protein